MINTLPGDFSLDFLVNYAKIKNENVLGAFKEALMTNLLQNVHHYSIYQAADGRYVTYIPDESKPKGRRQIRKTDKKALTEFLLSFYASVEADPKQKTIASIFEEWLRYKQRFISATNRKKAISPSTIRRYERDFSKYIADTDLAKLNLSELTAINLQLKLADIIESNSMNERCAANVISYISQILTFARLSGYIKVDLASMIDRNLLLSLCTPTKPKQDEERILNDAEQTALYQATLAAQARHPEYMPNYAIELAIFTGMRVGELAALHWTDIDDVYIHVDYSEHRNDYADRKSELVIAEPKCGKHRVIPVTSQIQKVLQKVKAATQVANLEQFIFVKEDGTRCTAHDISCAASRRGNEAGITGNVSIHRIRRTLSSNLNRVLAQNVVASILGHSEQVNEQYYNYSTADLAEKRNALENLSSHMANSVLKITDFQQNKKVAEAP